MVLIKCRIVFFLIAASIVSAFTPSKCHQRKIGRRPTVALAHSNNGDETRRGLFVKAAMAAVLLQPQSAMAIPMVTIDEFLVVLRDSARSIRVVEFSGPLSETVTIRLVDGTEFGLKDVVESPTDPRSPLKVSAACRANQVPVKFTNLEALLSSAPKKKKLYTNERVVQAQEKEKEKQRRIAQDEEDRLAELYRMEGMGAQQ